MFKNFSVHFNFYLLVTAGQSRTPLKGSCPVYFEDWDPNSVFCYMIPEGQVPWQDAQDICTNSGGNLASVNSQAEQDMLQQKAKENSINPWIGLWAVGKHIKIFVGYFVFMILV